MVPAPRDKTQPTNEHIKKWGNYNSVPPNMREITMGEFAQSRFFTYTPTMTEDRQFTNANVKSKKGSPLGTATLYFMHDETGFVLIHDHYGEEIRVFLFGCAHIMTEIKPDQPYRCWVY